MPFGGTLHDWQCFIFGIESLKCNDEKLPIWIYFPKWCTINQTTNYIIIALIKEIITGRAVIMSYRESHSLCKFPGEAIVDCVVCSSLRDLVLINDQTQISADLLGLGDSLDCLLY